MYHKNDLSSFFVQFFILRNYVIEVNSGIILFSRADIILDLVKSSKRCLNRVRLFDLILQLVILNVEQIEFIFIETQEYMTYSSVGHRYFELFGHFIFLSRSCSFLRY